MRIDEVIDADIDESDSKDYFYMGIPPSVKDEFISKYTQAGGKGEFVPYDGKHGGLKAPTKYKSLVSQIIKDISNR